VFRWGGGGLFSDLRWLGLFGDGDFVWAWRRLGLLFGDDRGGAWRFGGENAGVERALSRRKRNRRDNCGLNGSDVRSIFTPVDGSGVEEKRRADDDRSDEAVQQKRTAEVDPEPVAVTGVVVAELEVRGYDTLLTASMAG
jgi:hypothetical protein